MPLLSENPMWEAFCTRAMLQCIHRAADVGECVTTAERVGAPVRRLEPAADGAARATIVHVNGYDSTIHESFFANGPAALERGDNVLCFEGPGQGRPLVRDGLTMRPTGSASSRP